MHLLSPLTSAEKAFADSILTAIRNLKTKSRDSVVITTREIERKIGNYINNYNLDIAKVPNLPHDSETNELISKLKTIKSIDSILRIAYHTEAIEYFFKQNEMKKFWNTQIGPYSGMACPKYQSQLAHPFEFLMSFSLFRYIEIDTLVKIPESPLSLMLCAYYGGYTQGTRFFILKSFKSFKQANGQLPKYDNFITNLNQFIQNLHEPKAKKLIKEEFKTREDYLIATFVAAQKAIEVTGKVGIIMYALLALQVGNVYQNEKKHEDALCFYSQAKKCISTMNEVHCEHRDGPEEFYAFLGANIFEQLSTFPCNTPYSIFGINYEQEQKLERVKQEEKHLLTFLQIIEERIRWAHDDLPQNEEVTDREIPIPIKDFTDYLKPFCETQTKPLATCSDIASTVGVFCSSPQNTSSDSLSAQRPSPISSSSDSEQNTSKEVESDSDTLDDCSLPSLVI